MSKYRRIKIKNILLAVLPGLVVFGVIMAANTYYDLDLQKVIVQETQKIIGQLETTATTTLATLGGYVGIGTTTPAALLNVYGGDTQFRLSYSGTQYANFLVDAGGNLTIGPTGGILSLNTAGIQNYLRVFSTSTDYIQLTHSGTAGSLSVSAGNIEIGSPGAPIYLEGITLLTVNSASSALSVIQSGAGYAATFMGGYVGIGTSTPRGILDVWGGDFYVGSSTVPSLYVASTTGRVGIGTSSPSYNLDVSGGTGIVAQFSGRVIGGNAVNSNEFATLVQLSGGGGPWSRTGSNVYLTTSTDSVGIGTSTPAYGLDVYGTSRLGSSTSTQVILRGYVQSDIIPYQDSTYNLGASGFRWGNIYAATGTFGGTLTVNSNTISGNATTTLTTTAGSLILNPFGYVGIGTSTPAYGLDIWKTLRAAHVSTSSGSVIDSFSDETKIAALSSVVVSAGQAKLSQSACGAYTVTFTYNGGSVTYGTASSSGKCWLDRNLGASGVAASTTDSAAYGDLFQWGREDDGHQVRSPAPANTEGNMTLTTQPGNAIFIKEQTSPYDWATTTWITRWTVADDDPCPSGWRVPTNTEWDNERLSWSPNNNAAGAFASPLKLTLAGRRYYSDASLLNVVGSGYYWSSVATGDNAYYLIFHSGNAYMDDNYRAYGFSVRCVQD